MLKEMKPTCPRCGTAIDPGDVNVATDLAKCRGCNELYRASELVESADVDRLSKPPAGSRIRLDGDIRSEAILHVPRRRPGFGDVFALVFATFWISFIAFWTWGASQASVLFAAFSIPFWLAGAAMWVGLINGLMEHQTLRIGIESLELQEHKPFFARLVSIPYKEITKIAVEHKRPTNPFAMARHMRHFSSMSMGGGVPSPTIVHGARKTAFAETVDEPEMDWLVKLLKEAIFLRTRQRI